MSARAWRRLGAAVVAVGASLQVLFWSRPIWFYLDQIELFRLGMGFGRDGQLTSIGKLMTGDYPIPGVLLQLLIGAPLRVWMDARASTLVIVASHFLAAAILWRVLGRTRGAAFTALFFAIFWLSPWRLYHSGFMWEPSYLMLPAAVHLWACDRLREARHFAPSLILGATLILTAQVHGSALVLLLATGILWLGSRIRLHLPAVGIGGLLGSITVWPTIRALLAGSSIDGDPVADLGVRVGSTVKALVYWLRFGSLDLGRRFGETSFGRLDPEGSALDIFLYGLLVLTAALALLSVLLPLVAFVRMMKRRVDGQRTWIDAYSLAVLGAALVAAFASPVLIQGWHLLIALPAACLPVAAWVEEKSSVRGWLRVAIVLFVVWRIPAALLVALGHPMAASANIEQQRHICPDDLLELLPGA